MAGCETNSDAFARIDRWSQLTLHELVVEARRTYGDGKLSEVYDLCLVGLTQYPNSAPLSAILGWVYAQRADFAKAEGTFRHALCHDEASADSHAGLGAVLAERGDFHAAVPHYRRALELNAHDSRTLFNLGCALASLRRFDEAIDAFQQSLALEPAHAAAAHNLAIAEAQRGNWREAVARCDRALEIDPKAASARVLRGMARVALGSFADGWDDYETRRMLVGEDDRRFGLPKWNGPANTKQSILVIPEQGIGTQLLFASCLPDLVGQMPNVTIGCDPRLVGLLRRSFPGIHVMVADLLPAVAQSGLFDCHLMAGSLPALFRRTASDFRGGPYLVGEPNARQRWRQRLDALGSGLKIGVSWGGGGKQPDAGHRCTVPISWESLARQPNTHWINLHYDLASHERATWQRMAGWRFHDWPDVDLKYDIENFAALVGELDLVITVVNSTIHIAGALGAPTWALVPRGGEWRWLSSGEKCIWHDSVRLFRQQRLDDWTSVFDELLTELSALAGRAPWSDQRGSAA